MIHSSLIISFIVEWSQANRLFSTVFTSRNSLNLTISQKKPILIFCGSTLFWLRSHDSTGSDLLRLTAKLVSIQCIFHEDNILATVHTLSVELIECRIRYEKLQSNNWDLIGALKDWVRNKSFSMEIINSSSQEGWYANYCPAAFKSWMSKVL